MPFESVASYEAGRWEGVGPDWGIKVTQVTWKMYFWGKTIHDHVVKLQPEQGGEEDEQEYAMRMIRGIDQRILRWQRKRLNLKVEDLVVAQASLLRPHVGIEASQGAIKRISDGEIGEMSQDDLGMGSALQSMGKKKSGFTREHPGERLFCDEEALRITGLINEEQAYFYGIRCPGFWSVWKAWGSGLLVSQELIPVNGLMSFKATF